MAVRILSYVGLLYQDLIRSGQLTASGQLPPVLPLVLYNGARRWQAPEEVAELVATVPGGLGRYRPCLRYFLLDEGRFTEDDLAPLRLQRSEIRGPAGWGKRFFEGYYPTRGIVVL